MYILCFSIHKGKNWQVDKKYARRLGLGSEKYCRAVSVGPWMPLKPVITSSLPVTTTARRSSCTVIETTFTFPKKQHERRAKDEHNLDSAEQILFMGKELRKET